MALNRRIGSSSSFNADDDNAFVDDVSTFNPGDIKSRNEELLDDEVLDQDQGPQLKLKDGLNIRYPWLLASYWYDLRYSFSFGDLCLT